MLFLLKNKGKKGRGFLRRTDEENLIIAVNEPVQISEEETEDVIDDSESTSTEPEDSSDNSEEQSE